MIIDNSGLLEKRGAGASPFSSKAKMIVPGRYDSVDIPGATFNINSPAISLIQSVVISFFFRFNYSPQLPAAGQDSGTTSSKRVSWGAGASCITAFEPGTGEGFKIRLKDTTGFTAEFSLVGGLSSSNPAPRPFLSNNGSILQIAGSFRRATETSWTVLNGMVVREPAIKRQSGTSASGIDIEVVLGAMEISNLYIAASESRILEWEDPSFAENFYDPETGKIKTLDGDGTINGITPLCYFKGREDGTPTTEDALLDAVSGNNAVLNTPAPPVSSFAYKELGYKSSPTVRGCNVIAGAQASSGTGSSGTGVGILSYDPDFSYSAQPTGLGSSEYRLIPASLQTYSRMFFCFQGLRLGAKFLSSSSVTTTRYIGSINVYNVDSTEETEPSFLLIKIRDRLDTVNQKEVKIPLSTSQSVCYTSWFLMVYFSYDDDLVHYIINDGTRQTAQLPTITTGTPDPAPSEGFHVSSGTTLLPDYFPPTRPSILTTATIAPTYRTTETPEQIANHYRSGATSQVGMDMFYMCSDITMDASSVDFTDLDSLKQYFWDDQAKTALLEPAIPNITPDCLVHGDQWSVSGFSSSNTNSRPTVTGFTSGITGVFGPYGHTIQGTW